MSKRWIAGLTGVTGLFVIILLIISRNQAAIKSLPDEPAPGRSFSIQASFRQELNQAIHNTVANGGVWQEKGGLDGAFNGILHDINGDDIAEVFISFSDQYFQPSGIDGYSVSNQYIGLFRIIDQPTESYAIIAESEVGETLTGPIGADELVGTPTKITFIDVNFDGIKDIFLKRNSPSGEGCAGGGIIVTDAENMTLRWLPLINTDQRIDARVCPALSNPTNEWVGNNDRWWYSTYADLILADLNQDSTSEIIILLGSTHGPKPIYDKNGIRSPTADYFSSRQSSCTVNVYQWNGTDYQLAPNLIKLAEQQHAQLCQTVQIPILYGQ